VAPVEAMDVADSANASSTLVAPLALQRRWACRSVVGRVVEHAAIRQELAAAKSGRLAGLTFEGEPGIGKSRLLISAADLAQGEDFVVLAVTADEDLRGPFLLSRSLFASREVREGSSEAARGAFAVALEAMSGQDPPELAQLPLDEKLLRVFDLASVAIRVLAAERPVALLVDDAQWADQDSVRMLRYLVRAAEDVPLFLVFALRPEPAALGAELGALLSDMERVAMVRRLELSRFTQAESGELLEQLLDGQPAPATVTTMHAQAEGVPFILEELARTYRDSGLLQQVEGVWRLGPRADRLVPSAVRTLIRRRAAHLSTETRMVLAEAAVIGRAFSLKDLQAVKELLGEADDAGPARVADALDTAVAAGFLVQLSESAPADYRFTHEHIREFAVRTLPTSRRRAIHGALVDLLAADGSPSPESLPLLAHHALAAGDNERAARFACAAAGVALEARAPEEVLRLVDLGLSVSTGAQERIALLTARDDALDMLRRPVERLESLAELGALAEALADRQLLSDTTLRRTAALRLLEDSQRAAELATDVRRRADAIGDKATVLAACLQQGQALLGRPIGESFSPPAEADLDGAEEAYQTAARLAEELDDLPVLAAATRELGVIDVGRARAWYVDLQRRGAHLPYLERIAAGERAEVVVAETPMGPVIQHAQEHFERAVELFDRIGDRPGLMSSVIAMAYAPFALDIHLHGSAKRIEEIHRLATQLASLTMESGREQAEVQMLYGVHVFARAKGVADLALSRGRDAYARSRAIGDTGLEFVAAGGVALAHLDLGELDAVEHWLDRAAAAAAASPLPYRTRQLCMWRGRYHAAAGDGQRMRQLLEQAVQLAVGVGLPAARCEALARLALEAASLGARLADDVCIAVGAEAAEQAERVAAGLPGRPLWAAQAAAARTLVALTRHAPQEAAEAARRVFSLLDAAVLEDLALEVVLPAARGLLMGGTAEERASVSARLRRTLAFVSQRIVDEDVRVRWFRGPLGRELHDLVSSGPGQPMGQAGPGTAAPDLTEDEMRLLTMLVDGYTNREIAEALGVDVAAVASRLGCFYANIGTSSRADTTAFAFRERVI
jgi:DNA-binding NarL/FixJ family response regulator